MDRNLAPKKGGTISSTEGNEGEHRMCLIPLYRSEDQDAWGSPAQVHLAGKWQRRGLQTRAHSASSAFSDKQADELVCEAHGYETASLKYVAPKRVRKEAEERGRSQGIKSLVS